MNDDRRCAKCANWRPTLNPSAAKTLTVLGECHRYAPRPVVVTTETLAEACVVWPVTQGDDACGEWFAGGDRLGQA